MDTKPMSDIDQNLSGVKTDVALIKKDIKQIEKFSLSTSTSSKSQVNAISVLPFNTRYLTVLQTR